MSEMVDDLSCIGFLPDLSFPLCMAFDTFPVMMNSDGGDRSWSA